ncbi:MAG: xylulokinase [Acholeplasmataceae bacterium]
MYIGIDLGTSSVKLVLVSKNGKVIREVTKNYPIYHLNKNWSEQNPNDWWDSTVSALEDILISTDKEKIKGISVAGQMHGLVILDSEDNIIRPAILWNDGRAFQETDYLNNVVGKERLVEYTGNFAFAGFTAPKLLWLKKHEINNFNKIKTILLPKDYLVFRLTGHYSTDYSDASGTLLFDVKNKRWSSEMCEIIGVNQNQLPQLHESYEVVGNVKEDIANKFGISKTVKIIAGASDNAAAAIGTGTVNTNSCNVSLGTSGTVFVSTDRFFSDNELPIHSFNHANGKYHLMGCILSAASCNGWWVENILKSTYMIEHSNLDYLLGKNDVYFLPYLVGERCPHNDTDAKGAFIGIRMNTTREELSLSVLEGVGFALKECFDVIEKKGLILDRTTLCGGGAKSTIWAKILCNIFNKSIDFLENDHGPSLGAAILAMVGCKEYVNVEEACNNIIRITHSIEPETNLVKEYQKKYQIYKKLYHSLKNNYKNWD